MGYQWVPLLSPNLPKCWLIILALTYCLTSPIPNANAFLVEAKVNGLDSDTKLLKQSGTEVKFTVEPTPNDVQKFYWEFGDGNTSDQKSPSHTYKVPGDYAVKVTVSCDACDTAEESDTVAIKIVKVELFTPKGNPVSAPKNSGLGQNEYTFSDSHPGVLNVFFQASVVPVTADLHKIKDDVVFTIEKIGVSPVWATDNPGGRSSVQGRYLVATATFTGLPSPNSEFGVKSVQLKLENVVQETTVIEVFFPRDADNNPGGNAPNWFYYWKQESGSALASYANASYSGLMAEVPAMYRWDYNTIPDKSLVLIYDEVVTSTGGYGVGKILSGIDSFVGTYIHEQKHLDQILNADALLPTNRGIDSFRYGWSWNNSTHNHYERGPDGQWGRAGHDDDGNGTPDDAVVAPPFEPGSGDDVSLEHILNSDWPNTWTLPTPNSGPHPIESDAINASDNAINEHDFADRDWANPGKQHQTINVYDD